MIQMKRFASTGEELVPGLALRHHSNSEKITFSFFTVLDAVNPDAWHGEVRFGGRTLTTTDVYSSETQAVRAAEHALAAKVVALFSDDHVSDSDPG